MQGGGDESEMAAEVAPVGFAVGLTEQLQVARSRRK